MEDTMVANWGPLRKWILGLDLETLGFDRLGFNLKGEARVRLEQVSMTVVEGYNAAVELGAGRILSERIKMVKNELRGFFSEGVAMGLFTLDRIPMSSGNQLNQFLSAEGKDHEYMAYIGVGLAVALFHLNPAKYLDSLDPLSGPLLYDGYGFYSAYFRPNQTLIKAIVPKAISQDEFLQSRFDGGVGRALWFYAGGDVEKITTTISRFTRSRQGGLWAGIGLAATYAGGVSSRTLETLAEASDKYKSKLALGSSLAVHARHRAGNPHEDDYTCRLFTGQPSLIVHQTCDSLAKPLIGLARSNGRPALNIWTDGLESWLKQNEFLSMHAVPA
jgi:enediyne biosynthesis protein E3